MNVVLAGIAGGAKDTSRSTAQILDLEIIVLDPDKGTRVMPNPDVNKYP